MKVTALKQVSYDPSVFLNVETVDEAVRIILTPEDGLTSQQRWKAETPFIMEILKRHIKPRSLVLDYGCGIGRIAKPLIEMLQCLVVGVDISPNMRALAASCVDSDSFCAISPGILESELFKHDWFDATIAAWTLQHVLDLDEAIDHIHTYTKPGGILFMLNNYQRAIPSNAGPWLDDGKNVDDELLSAGFACIERGELQGDGIATNWLAKQTFWAVYRKT